MTAINANLGIPFPSKRDRRRYYLFNLRIGTLVLLWIGLILTSCFSFILLVNVYAGYSLPFDFRGKLTRAENVWCLLSFLVCGPISYALGLYGVYEKKPSFLSVCVQFRLFEIVRFSVLTVSFVVFSVYEQEFISYYILQAWNVSSTLDPHFLLVCLIGKAAEIFTVRPELVILTLYPVIEWLCYKMVKKYHTQLKTEIMFLRDGFSLLESTMKKPYNVTTYNIV